MADRYAHTHTHTKLSLERRMKKLPLSGSATKPQESFDPARSGFCEIRGEKRPRGDRKPTDLRAAEGLLPPNEGPQPRALREARSVPTRRTPRAVAAGPTPGPGSAPRRCITGAQVERSPLGAASRVHTHPRSTDLLLSVPYASHPPTAPGRKAPRCCHSTLSRPPLHGGLCSGETPRKEKESRGSAGTGPAQRLDAAQPGGARLQHFLGWLESLIQYPAIILSEPPGAQPQSPGLGGGSLGKGHGSPLSLASVSPPEAFCGSPPDGTGGRCSAAGPRPRRRPTKFGQQAPGRADLRRPSPEAGSRAAYLSLDFHTPL